jgi:hypothetical protein
MVLLLALKLEVAVRLMLRSAVPTRLLLMYGSAQQQVIVAVGTR